MAEAAVRSKAVVLLWLTFCLLLLPLWESVIVQCFVVRYFMSILVLQSSWWGKESWLLCLWCGSSSRCHKFVCSLRLWYFLIILTYHFYMLHTLQVYHIWCFSIENQRVYCILCIEIIPQQKTYRITLDILCDIVQRSKTQKVYKIET